MTIAHKSGRHFLSSRKKFYSELFRSVPFISDLEGDIVNLHSVRVGVLARGLAEGVLESDGEMVFLSGLYHDVGANGSHIHPVRARTLSEHSRNPWLKAHSIRANHVLKRIKSFSGASQAILEHHEWFDGSGYPLGRSKTNIMLEAQALRIADAYDIAMLALGNKQAAFSILEKNSGKEFDPDLLELFKRAYQEGEYEFLWNDSQKTLDRVFDFYENWQYEPTEEELINILLLFDLKKRPLRGHTRRVKNLVKAACTLSGSRACEAFIRSVFVHELYTTYEPYRGAFIGGVERREILERFPLINESFVELEEDPWVSELVRASCLFDTKLTANGDPINERKVFKVLSEMNGVINPEVIILLKKSVSRKGEELYAIG